MKPMITDHDRAHNGIKTEPRTRARPDRRSDDGPGITGYGRLTQLLREEIVSGRYADGERLKVSEIAKRFGTSTNPAREALQALEGEGLVTIVPNRGASVRAITEDLVHNVFDIRALLEPYIVRGFVEYVTPQDIANLTEIQKACEAAALRNDHPDYHHYNIQLHDYIANRHHNEEAVTIMTKHHSWLRTLARRDPMSLSQMRRASAEHWELLDAIAKGDADLAVAATETHMRNSRDMFIAKMRRNRVISARQANDGRG